MTHMVKRVGLTRVLVLEGTEEVNSFLMCCVNVKDGPSWFSPVDRRLKMNSKMEKTRGSDLSEEVFRPDL